MSNTGIGSQTSVRIDAVRPLSHPGISIDSINAVAPSTLGVCSSGSTSFDFTASGLAFGDTVVFEVDLTSDELYPIVRTQTLTIDKAESDVQFVATKTYDFETDLEGWEVIQGTFSRSNAGGGANGSSYYLRSSSLAPLQCDRVRSSGLKFTATTTMALSTNFDIEQQFLPGIWFDRANIAVIHNGVRSLVEPDSGRLYNASGPFGTCVTANQNGWADINTTWASSGFSATALGSVSLAGEVIQLDIAYGTDELEHGDGFRFDQLTLTDVEIQLPDSQSDACAPECNVDPDCEDGLFCNGAETCVAGACQAGSNPCPGQSCDEDLDTCGPCQVDADCDDGLFCNGDETCDAGTCQDGSAPNCADAFACTADSCNGTSDSCEHVTNDALCDNGLFCDGSETCSAVLGCQAGVSVDCADGVACTADSCNETSDSCDNVANDGLCDNGLFCDGSETCDAVLDCQAGSVACPGQICDEDGDTCFGQAQLESGSVSVGGSAVTVPLLNTYISPVVVTTMQYNNNTKPMVTRISNVTANSFDVRLQNPSGLNTPATENVSYLVVEEGSWTIDGHLVEAQTYTSTVTDEDGSWVGEVQSYLQSYTNPVVLGQVMSENDAGFSVFWDQGTVRTDPPSAAALTTGKTVAEDSDVTRSDETVGFIVFEAGHGTIGGVEYEAALGADTIEGVTNNSPPYIYTFNTPFAGSPAIALLTMAGVDGVNGGWAQVHGATLATTTSLFLSIDEDQILDAERDHTPEQVAYLVFAGPMLFPPCTIDADCTDGLFCTGDETCVAGARCCQAGGDACPGQNCDEAGDTCFVCQVAADCTDGLFCNGVETCVDDACQPGVSVDCDDGVGCTDDSCNETSDSCDNDTNDSLCDNGVFCDGSETCDAVLDCQAGISVNCDDGVGCTDDSCNETSDSCDNVTNDGNCVDNGLFCDGDETCTANFPGSGCESSGDACPGQSCDEVNDTCGACVVAGDCDDGSICTGVETCVLNACVAGTPLDCNDNVGCTDDSCDPVDGCASVPDDLNCDNGVFCDGEETCDVGFDCQADSNPCPGQSCNEGGGVCEDTALESGSVFVGELAVTVPLLNTYISPVVVTTMQYNNNTTPMVTRVKNVTTNSFDVRLQSPSGNPVATENVSYLVVEKGAWTIDGVAVEAQTYDSTVTDNDLSWVGEVQSYNQPYTNPVVLGQVMSEANPKFSVFWDQGTVRTNPPSAAALTTGKTVAEDTDIIRVNNETVGIIVFEAGHGFIGGVEYEAALGADTIEGVTDLSPPFIYTFNTPFAGDPTVALTTMAGMDGVNGGWAQVHGATLADTTRLYLSIDEDQINDPERDHTPEQVAYLVFAGPMLFPTCTEDADCQDNLFCTGTETCVNNACQATGDPCSGLTPLCDDDINQCVACQNDDDCGDSNVCNGAESCNLVTNLCESGSPLPCDDPYDCTVDSCDPVDGCANVPNDGNCVDNGLFCDGDETCTANFPGSGCESSGDACPGQSCDEVNDTCGACVVAGDCDDGSICTGVETCVDNACVAGTALDCNDNVGCTDDSCDPVDGCANVPEDLNCDNGVFCDGAETCDVNNDCQAPAEVGCPGQTCDEGGDSCSLVGQMEWGSEPVGELAVTVTLTNTYISPVIVTTMQYNNNTTPMVTRVKNVTTNSFDVRLQSPSGNPVATENVSYLVVEKGTWTIDGVAVEAQTYDSSVTDNDLSWVGEVQSYNQPYTNPVVLGQVMSEANPKFSVFWDQGTVRTNPPSAAALTTGKTVAEDTDIIRVNNETVGIIVFEAGHGTIGGVEYEAALGADTIEGVSDLSPPYIYTFNSTFVSGTPTVALTTMAGMDGVNGGWAQVHGATLADTNFLYLSIDEDQINDAERKHTPEQVAYVVFRAPGSFLYVP